MSLQAMLWALNDAPVETPTEALVLVAMGDYANGDGRGCFASRATLAAHSRTSLATVKRVLAALELRGLIVRGDQQMVAHYRPDRRPVVWDLAVPERGPSLSPRDDDGGSESAPRGVTTAGNGGSPVSHNPSTNPRDNPGPVARRETADGAVDGCAAHADRRRPACADCQRVQPPHRDQVRPADPSHAAAARAALHHTQEELCPSTPSPT